jgi:hypothetical protein
LDTRQQANRTVATAKRSLLTIRVALIVPAVLCGLLFVLFLAAGATDPVWLIPLTGGTAVAATLAAIYVLRAPLLATLVNALIATPLGVLASLSFLLSGSIASLLIALVVVAFWLAVPMAASTQRIMRRYPDLYAARAMRGESTGRHADKARREAARRLKRNLVIAGIALVLVVGVPLLLMALKSGSSSPEYVAPKPPSLPFEPAEAAWRADWNADRVVHVKGHLAASEKARREPFFDRMIKKRSWTPLPRLGPPDVEPSGAHRRIARYAVEGFDAALIIYWEWEKTLWVVVNWSFPTR